MCFQCLVPPFSALPYLHDNMRGRPAAAQNMQENCKGGSQGRGGRQGVHKRKNGQIDILILLCCSREMFSTQQRVVQRALRVNGLQYSHRPHTWIMHAYAHKHLQKQILCTGCLGKHPKNLHFTHRARKSFRIRTFMIVVQAALQTSESM